MFITHSSRTRVNITAPKTITKGSEVPVTFALEMNKQENKMK
jgi:hypothetical protein